jgi:hypothetical protein
MCTHRASLFFSSHLNCRWSPLLFLLDPALPITDHGSFRISSVHPSMLVSISEHLKLMHVFLKLTLDHTINSVVKLVPFDSNNSMQKFRCNTTRQRNHHLTIKLCWLMQYNNSAATLSLTCPFCSET